MSYEDIYWEIYYEMRELNLQKQFDSQLEKMKWQDKHKYRDTRDCWEYAANKVKKNNKKDKK